MTERYMIHVGGSPGSGKTRMSQALVKRLQNTLDLRVEHISIGDRVRALARGAIDSSFREYIDLHLANPHTTNQRVDEHIILSLLYRGVSAASESNTDVILVDGYPRYSDQAQRYQTIAEEFNYHTPGALVATIPADVALARMLKRGQKPESGRVTSSDRAWEKIALHNRNYPHALHELSRLAVHQTFTVYDLDTSGEKNQTDDAALEAALNLIDRSVPKIA